MAPSTSTLLPTSLFDSRQFDEKPLSSHARLGPKIDPSHVYIALLCSVWSGSLDLYFHPVGHSGVGRSWGGAEAHFREAQL